MSININSDTLNKVKKASKSGSSALVDDFIDAVARARKIKEIANGLSSRTIELVGGSEAKIDCSWNPKPDNHGLKVKLDITRGSLSIPPEGKDASVWIGDDLVGTIDQSFSTLSTILAEISAMFVDVDLIREDLESLASSSNQEMDWWVTTLRSEL